MPDSIRALLVAVLLAPWAAAQTASTGAPHAQSVDALIDEFRRAQSLGDDSAIRAAAVALAGRDADAADAIPWLWWALDVLPRKDASEATLGCILDSVRGIGRRACSRLPDAGRWIAWEGWVDRPIADSAAELLELTQHPIEELRNLAARHLAREHPGALDLLVERLQGGDADERVHAAAAVEAFADTPERLIAPLRACLDADDPRLRLAACRSLGACLPSSARALVEASGHVDPRVRREALYGLELGLDARWAVSPVPDLDLDGYRCQWSPEWGLEGTELLAPASLDALASRLVDPDPGHKILVLMIFTKLGRATAGGIERVRGACSDPHPGVRSWAEHALRRLDAKTSRAIEELLAGSDAQKSALQSATRLRQSELLRRLTAGPDFEPVWGPWGSQFPEAGTHDPRYEAAIELARRAPAAHPSRVLAVAERHVRTLIAVAIAMFPDGGTASQRLREVGPFALRQVAAGWLVGSWYFYGANNEGLVYSVLTSTLVDFGPRSLPVLCYGLENKEGYLETSFHLSRIAGAADVAGPALVAALRMPSVGPDPWLRMDDWESQDTFFRRLQSDPDGLDELERTCRSLGPTLIPWLLDALQDARAIVRARACRGLGALETASTPVVGALTQALQDDQAEVRFAAARGLLRLPVDEELAQRCRASLAVLGERP